MLTPARPSSSATSATIPGRFGTRTRSSWSGPPAISVSISSRRRRPASSCQAVTASRSPERSSSAASLETGDRGIDLGGDGLAVAGEDVAPDRRVGARHPGGVAEARPDLGQVLGLLAERRRGLRDQHVGDHVRQMADRRHQAVVRLGLDRLRARAQVSRSRAARGRRGSRPVVGVGVRYQRAPSKRSARAFSTPEVSAPASGMPADEAAVRAEGGDQVPLHRADVGDRAILGRRVQRLGGEAREAPSPGRRRRPAPPPRPPPRRLRARSRSRRAPPPARAAPGRGRIRPLRRRAWRERRARSTHRSAPRRGRRSSLLRLCAAHGQQSSDGRASAPSCPSPCRRR